LFDFQLTEVNDKMAEVTSNLSFSQPSASQMHTLQRHRDILKDYSQEFTKTKVGTKKYHQDLPIRPLL
jgi:hypothetical protein